MLIGLVWCDSLGVPINSEMPPPYGSRLFKPIQQNKAASVCFHDPLYPTNHVFPARLIKKSLMCAILYFYRATTEGALKYLIII